MGLDVSKLKIVFTNQPPKVEDIPEWRMEVFCRCFLRAFDEWKEEEDKKRVMNNLKALFGDKTVLCVSDVMRGFGIGRVTAKKKYPFVDNKIEINALAKRVLDLEIIEGTKGVKL